jgi:hypothetical protein
MRALALCQLTGAMALAACGAPSTPVAPAGAAARSDVGAELHSLSVGGVAVTRTMPPAYAMWDGATARRDADALCGGKGVRSSIYDRYQAGTWIFVGGCA